MLGSPSISCLTNLMVLPFILELGLPWCFPGVEAAGAASAHCSQLIPAVEHKPLMEQRMAEQELVQAGIHRFWEAARTSNHCPVTTDTDLG